MTIETIRHVGLASIVLLVAQAALACELRYDPASIPRYYRAEGWELPGTTDFNRTAPATHGLTTVESIPGATASILLHDDSPYIIEFPAAQEFVLNGVRQRMRPAHVKAAIVRVSVGGRIVGYSYQLIPVTAHRRWYLAGKWIVTSSTACVFRATFIDDKGDGVFRILAPGAFTADLLPQWARPKPKT